ncbi:NnrU family protein [Pseudorhodobacter sp.]|uniref:NnrU family protein n=1 Tax=Pseudorhodobacter sp. TaxID=1934400 RepID=UPI00264A3F3C|nr:NnrU family protein [Pseudorhodobacter sp.]MDN5787041.1 NnrU family protein [Pseudorhodobacter sp.]
MTGTWTEFFLAFMVFLASHMIPSRPKLRAALQARLGPRGFILAYSVLSTLLLVWLIVAAGNVPFEVVWDQMPWQRWVVNLAMPFAVALAVFGIGAPNPLSFGGRKTGFDPAHPGIAGVTRHPLLWALALWSGVHTLVNGDLAHVVLFGSFTAFALLGMVAIDRRNQRQMGAEKWQELAQHTRVLPLAALVSGRWHPIHSPNPLRLVGTLLIWAGVLMAHLPVIGVSPLP